MNAQARYRSPTAFRTALEQRLRHEAHESGIALNRLRKEAAFNRLLCAYITQRPRCGRSKAASR